MKKKQMLATLVMLSILQSTANAALNYEVTEDTQWSAVLKEYYGDGRGNRTLHANDTLTIKNNATVKFDYPGDEVYFFDIPAINSYDYDQEAGKYVAGDVSVTGGNIEFVGPANQIYNYAIYNEESYYSNIKLDGTNTYFKDFQYGIMAQGGTTEILHNEYAKFENINHGIYATKKDTSVKLTAKEITFNNGMEAIHTYFKSNVTIDNIDKDGSKVEIINHHRGIGAENQSEINIKLQRF